MLMKCAGDEVEERQHALNLAHFVNKVGQVRCIAVINENEGEEAQRGYQHQRRE
jgi:glutamate 5-kinase